MNTDDIARYLRNHPDFFEQYPDLVATLRVPHPHGGRAIPLAERQLVSLRDRNRALEGKLHELIQFGEENDGIAQKVHDLAVTLIGVTSIDGALGCIHGSLREDFAVPHVAIRVWRGTGSLAEQAEVSEAVRAQVNQLSKPYCGPTEDAEPVSWFATAPGQVQSLALVPLRDGGMAFGVIALGSGEPQRFYPEMGTLYLDRLGEMIAASLIRLL